MRNAGRPGFLVLDPVSGVMGLDAFAEDENIQLMTVRRGVYQTLSRLWMEEVDQTFWEALKVTAFPSLPESPRLDQAFHQLEGYLAANQPGVLTQLAADYAILCRGASPVKGADPYESVHRNPLGLMMQDEWEDVLRFYRKAGYHLLPTAVEPEDHLGIELDFMACLCDRYIRTVQLKDKETSQESLMMQSKMLDAHLLKWVPHFVQEVLRLTATDFYQAVAVITQEYLLMDRGVLATLIPDPVAGTPDPKGPLTPGPTRPASPGAPTS